MATSAVFPQGGAGKLYFEVVVELLSQDHVANTSTVKWEAYVAQSAPTGAWCLYHDAVSSVIINNVTVFQGKWNGTGDFDFRGLGAWAKQPVANGTLVIPHNADGTATVSWWASATDTSFPLGTAEVSGSRELPTIPRGSDFTMNVTSVPCDGVSTVGVNITPSVAGALHDVFWGFDGQPVTEHLAHFGVSTSTVSPPIPKAWANQYPNSNNGPMWCTVVTYYNGKELGRKTKYLTMAVPQTTEFYPTISTSHQQLQHPGLAGVPDAIQGYTGWRFTINSASGVYGSRVARLEIVGPNGSKQGDQNFAGPLTLDVNRLTTAGTQTYYLRVYDSRGRVSQTQVDVLVKGYSPPRVLDVSVNRSLSNGSPSNEGTNVRIEGTATYTPFNGNEYLVFASYRAAGTTTWSPEVVLASGAIPDGSAVMSTFAGTQGSNTLTPDKAWEIKVVIGDRTQLYEIVLTLPKARYIQSVDTNASSVAFGGPANASTEFRVYESMPAYFDGALFHRGQDVGRLYGTGQLIYGPKTGVLVTTDITSSQDRMFLLDVRVNTYSPKDPPGTVSLQGYAYASGSAIIYATGTTNMTSFPVRVFYTNDRLCFWWGLQSPFRTYAINLVSNFSAPVVGGNESIVSVTDSALPATRAREVLINCDTTADFGWQDIALSADVVAVSPVQTRRIGSQVHLRGAVAPPSGVQWSGQAVGVGTVPANCRPAANAAVVAYHEEPLTYYSAYVSPSGGLYMWARAGANPTFGGSWLVG